MASAELVFERSFYIGVVMTSIVYGTQANMFLRSLYYIVQDPRRTREQIIYVAYGGLVLLAVTIVIVTKSFEWQQMLVENPNYPGGPAAYLAAHAASWAATLNGAAVVFTDVLVNLFLLYRCFIIWNSVVLISLLPALVFLAATGLGIASFIESALAANIYTGVPAEIGVHYIALTVSFNVLVTLLIALRLLLLMDIRMRDAFASVPTYRGGAAAGQQPYTGIATMLIESASPAAAAGIAFIVLYARRSGFEYTLSQLWAAFMALTPQLIILRVTMGRAWTHKGELCFTEPIQFARRTERGTAWSAASGDESWGTDASRSRKDEEGIPAGIDTVAPVELNLRPSRS
ncbi:hypothetical protein CONPUDRAFT_137219 [Coniophora puteana RWD-64-598 SS2]|uniref:Uncharacterized protein n=1 Tax=Coniophora puteana (strain RWD-64-598) TaxID=741705 RepID=A0A5M3MR65_CONPW|nr:uncharacterized protein CONPUDRAFT_137219 [Coniophora puteana RWD-64-598 SS2]EIW81145.1 hypothetical protein CONPUDRAFT_137219 [Coniophora puteana RWD-64-598 SS2]